MGKQQVDYSLYLVTDSTPAILGAKGGPSDICDVVEAAILGGQGATCVQYREKTADTGAMIETAKRLHAITSRHGVPLLINDRVDVALAVGCEGVHIGQDDMDLATARKLLGDDKIIGVTVCNADETKVACEGGADYLGIGTVFATPTKENTKSIIGIEGLQQRLIQIAAAKYDVKTVCIGGINASNVSRVMWQSDCAAGQPVDGVAVVSAIMAARDPASAAQELRRLVRTSPPFAPTPSLTTTSLASVETLMARVPEVLRAVDARKPLSHNMTNLVVQNLAANVALCSGASPIMANYGEEAKDLAQLGGALVVNMGTVTPEGLKNYIQALKAYNDAGRPVVFDPVGASATSVRRAATKTILGAGYIDILKGNQAEILSCVASSSSSSPQQQQRGVDSGPSTLSTNELAATIRDLASRRRNIVVATGKTDYVASSSRASSVFAVSNGHEYLGMVTGTGCCLGTVISAAVAALPPSPQSTAEDRLGAVLAAMLHYNIAAELAAEREDVRGPGTFVPAFLDELARIRRDTVNGELGWLGRAKVEEVTV